MLSSIVELTFDGRNVFEGTLAYIPPENSGLNTAPHDMTDFPNEYEEQNKIIIAQIQEIAKKYNKTLV